MVEQHSDFSPHLAFECFDWNNSPLDCSPLAVTHQHRLPSLYDFENYSLKQLLQDILLDSLSFVSRSISKLTKQTLKKKIMLVCKHTYYSMVEMWISILVLSITFLTPQVSCLRWIIERFLLKLQISIIYQTIGTNNFEWTWVSSTLMLCIVEFYIRYCFR